MEAWTIEQVERARARILADVSDLVPERVRGLAEHAASWGNPKRCETSATSADGDCLFCGAINGETCRPR